MEGAEVQHVLVAVDDSEASEQAAEFVNRFFGDLDVVITAVNVGTVEITWGSYAAAPGALYPWSPVSTAVAPPAGPGGPTPSETFDAHRDIGERTIASSGVDADREVVEVGGDVAETLSRIAQERGADLIVVGSSHKGVLDRLLEPSVSKELARTAPVPVLVVH